MLAQYGQNTIHSSWPLDVVVDLHRNRQRRRFLFSPCLRGGTQQNTAELNSTSNVSLTVVYKQHIL